MPVKHQTQSGRGDNTDAGAIQPSHWNADHLLTGLLALIDAVSPTPNSIFTLDGSNHPIMLPISSLPTANSPAFTGVPTAPTAPDGTNSTQIANTAFVAQAIADLIASAPGALNTLKELADAIGDDANFAATVTNALALKAPLASPAFSGAPTAPTPATNDNSTRLPTTAFVQAVLAAYQGAQGQCRLAKSGANIVLSPVRGNLLTVAGANCSVPSGGVSLAPTGLTAGTLYYIYATASAGVVNALVASTTGHVTDATTGVEVMSGDATKTLVGMVRPVAGPAFADTSAQRFVRSWFNRVKPTMSGTYSANRTVNTTSFVEPNTEIRSEFLSWADESIQYGLNCFAFNSTTDYTRVGIGFDGSAPAQEAASFGANGSAACVTSSLTLAEGYHYATVMGRIGVSSTGTIAGVVASSPLPSLIGMVV